MGIPEMSSIVDFLDYFLRGIPVLLMVTLLPLAIYDRKKGEYKGFFNPLAVLWLVAAAAAAWRLNVVSESPRIEAWQFSTYSVLCMIVGARIMVEAMHRKIHDGWLHKQGVWLLKQSPGT